mgnify:CR=1 FL=1
MATFTSSERTGVKEMPTGINVKTGAYSLTGTATASSVFFLCRVPHDALIVHWAFFVESGGADNTWDLGIRQPEGSASSTLLQSVVAGQISDSTSVLATPGAPAIAGTAKGPVHVSISSENPTRWAWVTAVNAVACSATAVLRLTVWYTMDEAIQGA